jgi:hypothetical protein
MHTLEELRAHLADVKSRMQEMDGEAVGRVFTSEEQSEFDALKEERSTTESTITHLEERTAYVASLVDTPEHATSRRRSRFAGRASPAATTSTT